MQQFCATLRLTKDERIVIKDTQRENSAAGVASGSISTENTISCGETGICCTVTVGFHWRTTQTANWEFTGALFHPIHCDSFYLKNGSLCVCH